MVSVTGKLSRKMRGFLQILGLFLMGIFTVTLAEIREHLKVSMGNLVYPVAVEVNDSPGRFFSKGTTEQYAVWYRNTSRFNSFSLTFRNLQLGSNVLLLQGAFSRDNAWRNIGPVLTGSRQGFGMRFGGYVAFRMMLKQKEGSFQFEYNEYVCNSPNKHHRMAKSCTNGHLADSQCEMGCADQHWPRPAIKEPYIVTCRQKTRFWKQPVNQTLRCVPKSEIAENCLEAGGDSCGYSIEELLEIFDEEAEEEQGEIVIDLENYIFDDIFGDSSEVPEYLRPPSTSELLVFESGPRDLVFGGTDTTTTVAPSTTSKPQEHICTSFCQWAKEIGNYNPRCGSITNSNPEAQLKLREICMICRGKDFCATYGSVF